MQPAYYAVIDTLRNVQLQRRYKTRATASRAVDRLDNAYGAYRYRVVMVMPE